MNKSVFFFKLSDKKEALHSKIMTHFMWDLYGNLEYENTYIRNKNPKRYVSISNKF